MGWRAPWGLQLLNPRLSASGKLLECSWLLKSCQLGDDNLHPRTTLKRFALHRLDICVFIVHMYVYVSVRIAQKYQVFGKYCASPHSQHHSFYTRALLNSILMLPKIRLNERRFHTIAPFFRFLKIRLFLPPIVPTH